MDNPNKPKIFLRGPDDYYPVAFRLPEREEQEFKEEILSLFWNKRESTIADFYYFLYEKNLETLPTLTDVPLEWQNNLQDTIAYFYATSFSKPFAELLAAFFLKNILKQPRQVGVSAYYLAYLLKKEKITFEQAYHWKTQQPAKHLIKDMEDPFLDLLKLGFILRPDSTYKEYMEEKKIFGSVEAYLKYLTEELEKRSNQEKLKEFLDDISKMEKYAPYYVNLLRGQVFFSLRKYDEARAAFEKAFLHRPDDALVNLFLYDMFIHDDENKALFHGRIALNHLKSPAQRKQLESAIRKQKRFGVFRF